MCGLCGVAYADPSRPAAPDELAAMMPGLRHRGPDDQGRVALEGVALGHTRLSILDLSPAGRQPLANEDASVHVVFNGEIYNHVELRRDLESRGHRFRSRTDGEVLVHLYEERGADLVHELRGMFAFALWDARTGTLLLARDRLGKKPLAWTVADGSLLFASELAALVAHPSVPRRVDPTAVEAYLAYQYVPAPRTAFAGVLHLPAGHLLTWRDGRATVRRWWQPTCLPRVRPCAGRLLELLEESVRLRMRSDVPVGAFLSGGLDSSVVVALMARHGRVRTFSVGFAETGWDELPHARRVSRLFGTEHHEVVVRPEAARLLPNLVRHYGQPFADTAALPTWYLSRYASHHVKVAMTGDGGDEAFAGYRRYRAAMLGSWLRRAGVPWPRWLVQGSLVDRYGRRVWAFPPTPSARSLMAGWLAGPGEVLDRVVAADVAGYLPDDLLVKTDIASMAFGLELRSPLLDHHVVEYGLALPVSARVRGLSGKWLLRQAAARLLPPAVLRRPKTSFEVPVSSWLRGPLREMLEDLVLGAPDRGYGVDPGRLVREHLAGRDHGQRLWMLLLLELWHREFGV